LSSKNYGGSQYHGIFPLLPPNMFTIMPSFVEEKYCKEYDSRNCKADCKGEQWRKNVYNFFDGKKA
jgi:hypothetical protein